MFAKGAEVDGKLEAAADRIREIGGDEPLTSALLLDRGMEGMLEGLQDVVSLHFRDLPGFPALKDDAANDGCLTLGTLEGVRVACLSGHGSYAETGELNSMAFPFETLTLLGCTNLVMACGVTSVKADFLTGHLVNIADHINLSGLNPLVGAASAGGYMSLAEAYDGRMQRRLRRATIGAGVTFQDAVLMWLPGPVFATPAEARVARLLGADVIGHSFIPELIVARRIGLRVLSLGAVAGFSAGFQNGNPTHASFRAGCQQGVISLRRLWRAFHRVKET
ncbi:MULTISPECIES: purine-nucleoside phosphorylase [unclassified Beijerinckia]|uniref:purine-nucleoside phosphorylase n=1 Tax=unclassified Beijerinckia TaxID=2638183 RepID=UPI00089A70EA|nr:MULTISPECIES: purine-nucleoside phosphorylase [unclassified Beijerinckia]MDH7796834.1 purine-nucleoside phosphorylase [Beijerinckia sp. GAS462]SEC61731.1 purine-nucleoside phosphorylase [Beijerinckia sp. 28-YEA-48]